MELARRVALTAIAFTLVACADGQSWTPPQAAPSAEGVFEAGTQIPPYAIGMVRAQSFAAVSLDLWAGTRSPDAPEPAHASLRLNLFEEIVDARVVRVRVDGASRVWEGEVLGHPGSSVSLAQRGDALAGTVRWDGRLVTITPRGGDTVVAEWDEDAIPEDAPAVTPRSLAPPVGLIDRTATEADGEAVLDVLVVYSDEAADAAGGDDALDATIDLAVAEANASFVASGVSAALHLTASVRVHYDEADFDFEEALSRLATPGDGYLDEVQALRDAFGADHVVFIVDRAGPYAGIGYQLTASNAPFFSEAAYSVVSRDYAAGFYTFAHELGHNLGANHDPLHASDGYRADARGHQVPAAGYRTIMAYACDGAVCRRAGVWSDPNRTHEGAATGVPGVSDNARTLRETVLVASGFRDAPPSVEPVAAVLRTPSGALSPGPVWFRWDEVGADAHYLTIGRSPGDRSYYRAGVGRASEVRIDTLPESGETLHVRLWSLFGTEWIFTDATLQAAPGTPQGAQIAVPSDGATLTSTWTWFAWTDVAGALEHRLQVGTAAEPARYFDRAVGTDRAVQVAGLPFRGEPVVAQLWTRTSEGWVSETSTYAAWSAPSYASALLSPTNGSALTAGATTFVWDERGAPYHWLLLVDASGHVLTMDPTSAGEVTVQVPAVAGELTALLYSYGTHGWAATTARFSVD